ncbi:Integrase catalytic region [Candidatus Desulfarcum epimagneticum]|uniref:Integrase catalytic region n=1 Tax=uncultured Desulfobacteraceae bacterium TaxID=218296 RepID=A0A484HLI3_9BACT|nr:Integrase catalytic region [uncultured Desulfobacteraceae bacterium]
MISYELFCKIRQDNKQGLKPSQTADRTGLDVRTVKKWLECEQYRPRRRSKRKSKLDPFKDYIASLMEIHSYSAMQICQRIQEEGFTGGYSIVKEYAAKIRPRKTKPFLTLSFAPGECAQVDWGSYGSVDVGETRRRLSFFVMVLCHSRMMYVEFTVSQTMEHFLRCHQNAFDFFGGVPKKIMVDNLKSAVLKRAVGHDPVFNPKYLDFANHYGFVIAPCGVGKGNEKGRVESGVGYVKKNFLAGLEIPHFKIIKPAIQNWLDAIANVRIHGETKKRPADMFEQERKCLTPVSPHDYDIAVISKIRAGRQFRVSFDSNRYSVPAEYAGELLDLKAYPDRLCLYHENKLIARHPRSYDRHKDFEDPDHPKELIAQRKRAKNQKIFARFLMLSPKSESYYQKLRQRRMNPLHHITKIVGLSEIYGWEPVAEAIEDAFAFHAFSSEYIANILEQKTRKLPEPGALRLTHKKDLLDLSVQEPDMTLYDKG